MRTTAHLEQLEGGAVVGHQDLEGGVVHRRVVNLQGGQGLGVDEDHRQRRGEVRLSSRAEDTDDQWSIADVRQPEQTFHQILLYYYTKNLVYYNVNNTIAIFKPVLLETKD